MALDIPHSADIPGGVVLPTTDMLLESLKSYTSSTCPNGIASALDGEDRIIKSFLSVLRLLVGKHPPSIAYEILRSYQTTLVYFNIPVDNEEKNGRVRLCCHAALGNLIARLGEDLAKKRTQSDTVRAGVDEVLQKSPPSR